MKLFDDIDKMAIHILKLNSIPRSPFIVKDYMLFHSFDPYTQSACRILDHGCALLKLNDINQYNFERKKEEIIELIKNLHFYIKEGKKLVRPSDHIKDVDALRAIENSLRAKKAPLKFNYYSLYLLTSLIYSSNYMNFLSEICNSEDKKTNEKALDITGSTTEMDSAMLTFLNAAQDAYAFGLASYERTTGKMLNVENIEKEAISRQARKNRKGTISKKKAALIEGLSYIVKKMEKIPTELDLRKWLSSQEGMSITTGLTLCPEIWLEKKGHKKFISYTFREKDDENETPKESKITVGTYKNEYIRLLRDSDLG